MILSLFAVGMIMGTLLESRYGSSYAQTAVYFSWWFLGLQGVMALSLIVAVIDRLPFQRRLLGFYIVHAGLVTIILGSVFTRFYGIDGLLYLEPNKPSNQIRLQEEQLEVSRNNVNMQRRDVQRWDLPKALGPRDLSKALVERPGERWILREYLPYASESLLWQQAENFRVKSPKAKDVHAKDEQARNSWVWYSKWIVSNQNMAQSLELSLPSTEVTDSKAQMGPLLIQLLDEARFLSTVKGRDRDVGVRLFFHGTEVRLKAKGPNSWRGTEETTGPVNLFRKLSERAKVEYYGLMASGGKLRFFPRYSKFPVNESLEPERNQHYELFVDEGESRASGIKRKVYLSPFANGTLHLAYEHEGRWYQKEGDEFSLPWMSLKLVLQDQKRGVRPIYQYVPIEPQKEANQNVRAARIEILREGESESLWVSDRRPYRGSEATISISDKTMELPWSLMLEKFEMDTNPGTMDPASYESFVEILPSKEKAHIYMNHPLKKGGYTFYQSSYMESEMGTISVLSVNQDPGRGIKYLGSFLLVLGLILHYLIMSKKIFRTSKTIALVVFSFFIMAKQAILAEMTSSESTVVEAPSEVVKVCQNPKLGITPILEGGRVKPMIAYARELRTQVLALRGCEDLSDSQLFCELSFMGDKGVQEHHHCVLKWKISHPKLKEAMEKVGFEVQQGLRMREQWMQEFQTLESMGKEKGDYGIAIGKQLNAFAKWQEVVSGQDWRKIPESLSEQEQSQVTLEAQFEKLRPFYLATWFALIAFLVSLVAKGRWEEFSRVLSVGVLLLGVVGIGMRVLISGRGPVTNMYETVMWTGFGVLAFALVVSLIKRQFWVLRIGLIGVSICLFMMNFGGDSLDGSIRPLVPVLRDNFWLSTHVTTITLSYACFLLSWIIANIILLKAIVGGQNFLLEWNATLRMVVQVGTVLLAAGIILGGIWADYSWGRFWGWDPKETWSLIALVAYMIILHGKYAGWFQEIYFAVSCAAGFLFVLMAWFGVNYILATGLHSYGFSSGGAKALFAVFFGQVVFLAFVSFLQRQRKAGP